MKYIMIQNNGQVNEIDLTSLGLSSKRGDNSKIGQFGSGWKYALAWLMRNESIPEIYSGMDKIHLDTTTVLHRDQPVSFITINGRQTDITLGFGELDWTPWMALRELISNAMDEGGFVLKTVEDIDPPEDGVTKIFIPLTEGTKEVIVNYHQYFCFDRLPSYQSKDIKIFLKAEESPWIVYRKDIRCNTSKQKTFVDISLNQVDINESRIASDWAIDTATRKILEKENLPVSIWEGLLKGSYRDILPMHIPDSAVAAIKVLSNKYHIECSVNISLLGALQLGLVESDKPLLIIPDKWYNHCAKSGIIDLKNSNIEMIGEVAFIELEDNRKGEVEYYLKNIGMQKQIIFGSMQANKELVVYQNKILIKTTIQATSLEIATLILQASPLQEVKNILEPYFT
jgi:hypothetical protein